MSLKTKSGLTPVENEIPFTITTEQAEAFLQKQFDGAVALCNQKDDEHRQGEVRIMLLTVKCSKKFAPFMLLLPTNVLMGKKERKNDQELDIFNPGSSDKIAKLKSPFFNLVGSYMYDKNDERCFFSNSWRQALGVSLKTSQMLKNNRIPKIQRFNKGQNEYVACMIDPLRLFHAMLASVDDNDDKINKFGVEIASTEQIKSGNWKYETYRVARKKKKGDRSLEERIAFEIGNRLNG